MPSDPPEVSADHLNLTVDGQVFAVTYDVEQPGTYHYSWLSGPNRDYGFSSRGSDHQRRSVAEHEHRIRAFLSMVDPTTGYIEDDES